MKIRHIEAFNEEELLRRIKQVTLMKQPEEKIYQHATVSLEKMRVEEIAPAQNYVLKAELQKVRDLKWAIAEQGYNLFELNGFLRISLEGETEPFDLLPPVVEESFEADGRMVSILNDGMHRITLARMEWQIPQVVYVRGVPKEKPYYAFPLHQGWDDVKMVDDLPAGYVKKWHRIPAYKTLYRDFNSAFRNVGGPRGHFQNEKKS